MTIAERAVSEQQWYDQLGRLLRQSRKNRGWTIYDVAAVAEVRQSAVSRWERGLDRMKAYQYDRLRREGLLP